MESVLTVLKNLALWRCIGAFHARVDQPISTKTALSFAHQCESARNDRIDLRSGDLTVASSAWASAEEEGQ
jgi:hypothetical protein